MEILVEIFSINSVLTLFATEAVVDPMSAFTDVACDDGRCKIVFKFWDPLPIGVGIFCSTGTAMLFFSNWNAELYIESLMLEWDGAGWYCIW